MFGCSINHTPEQLPDKSPIKIELGTIQVLPVSAKKLQKVEAACVKQEGFSPKLS